MNKRTKWLALSIIEYFDPKKMPQLCILYFIFQTQKDVSKKTNDKDISASHQGILSQIKWHQQYVRQNAGVLNLITVLLRKVIKLYFFFNDTCNVLHTSLMTNISSSYIFTK